MQSLIKYRLSPAASSVAILLGGVTICARSGFSVTWEAQAERLQMVSASYLDAQPLLSPSASIGQQLRIEGKTVVSILPKMNATVGAKTEQPPQPPAHSIPTLEVSYLTARSMVGHGVIRAWQGYLPGDAGRTVGMNASCGQNITGFSLGLRNDDLGILSTSLEIGQQWNQTKIAGGITESTANDIFQVKTRLRFAALTLTPSILPRGWIQAQIAERKVATHFDIPSDGTTFDLTDSSSIRGNNAATQLTLGYDLGLGMQAAVAYLNVPQRSSMPRFLLSYSRHFGGKKFSSRNQ